VSDPMPPAEWGKRIKSRDAVPGHVFPPRPETVEVTASDIDERVAGETGHEGYRPAEAPVHSTPSLVRPEDERPPRWRRPPGQVDDLGEPSG
jgi:hypothetical protein